jgi:hypothetical protein
MCCHASAALFLALLLAVAPAVAEDAGFRTPLFNSQDLAGWHVTDCDVAVEDGALVLKSGNGLVRTDHRYGDFVLELEWRARKAADWDSGIYFRAELPADRQKRPWPARYQCNLLSGQEGNVNNLSGASSAGLVKPGEWNQFKLTCIGSHAELELNGQPAWSADGVEAPAGYIGLQAEVDKGGEFEFRNIVVTELDHRALFNGQDLAGWEGGDGDAAASWQAEDGTLACTGAAGCSWLRSQEEYGDFNLRLEYQLPEAGNSGIFVRVPLNGAHREKDIVPPPAGVEVQLLDDPAERWKDAQDYQRSASIYAVAAASPHVTRPAGEWNSLEIDCRGLRYRIVHNGIVVVEADGDSHPELKNRQERGYLGLQNYNLPVHFRNLRIGPSLE